MEPLFNNGICRCCASEGNFKDFLSSYHWMGEEEIYADMLKDCFSITLTTSDEVSNGGICEVCITQLRNACNFKRQVQQTEEQFKRQLEDILLKSNPIKIELTRDDGDLSDTNMSEDFSANDYEVPIKVEELEEKPKKRQAKASTSRAKKAKTTDGEPSAKRKKKMIIILKKAEAPKLKVVAKKESDVSFYQENISTILLNTNATPIRSRSSLGYACCFCPNQYQSPSELKEHSQKHTALTKSNFMSGVSIYDFSVKLDITDLKCTICESPVPTIHDITEHLQEKHNKPYHKSANNFIIPFKFNADVLNCLICGKIFNSFKVLTEHMNCHYENYMCEVCGAGFVTRKTLKRHVYRHETGSFPCTFCSKSFETKVRKIEHERAVHIYMNRRNKCAFCGEKFTDYTKKNDHEVEKHGVKPLVISCSYCGRKYSNQRALTVHQKSVHLLVKK